MNIENIKEKENSDYLIYKKDKKIIKNFFKKYKKNIEEDLKDNIQSILKDRKQQIKSLTEFYKKVQKMFKDNLNKFNNYQKKYDSYNKKYSKKHFKTMSDFEILKIEFLKKNNYYDKKKTTYTNFIDKVPDKFRKYYVTKTIADDLMDEVNNLDTDKKDKKVTNKSSKSLAFFPKINNDKDNNLSMSENDEIKNKELKIIKNKPILNKSTINKSKKVIKKIRFKTNFNDNAVKTKSIIDEYYIPNKNKLCYSNFKDWILYIDKIIYPLDFSMYNKANVIFFNEDLEEINFESICCLSKIKESKYSEFNYKIKYSLKKNYNKKVYIFIIFYSIFIMPNNKIYNNPVSWGFSFLNITNRNDHSLFNYGYFQLPIYKAFYLKMDKNLLSNLIKNQNNLERYNFSSLILSNLPRNGNISLSKDYSKGKYSNLTFKIKIKEKKFICLLSNKTKNNYDTLKEVIEIKKNKVDNNYYNESLDIYIQSSISSLSDDLLIYYNQNNFFKINLKLDAIIDSLPNSLFYFKLVYKTFNKKTLKFQIVEKYIKSVNEFSTQKLFILDNEVIELKNISDEFNKLFIYIFIKKIIKSILKMTHIMDLL